MPADEKQNLCSVEYYIFVLSNIGKNILNILLIIKKIIKNKFILIICPLLFFCQPVEVINNVEFDNNTLTKINLNANEKIINLVYEIKYVDPYIDHSMKFPPLQRVSDWLDQNINIFGSYNKLIIDIIDASITRVKKENKNNKKYEEKIIFYYEIHFDILFVLYDDNDLILATTQVESLHSTTSSQFISLNEKENILDNLILIALVDLSNKAEELLKKHMFQYIL